MLGVGYAVMSTTDPFYATVASMISAFILPKITVGHCVNVVSVNVPPVALITVYCSVSPAAFPCAISTCIMLAGCVTKVLFK